MTGSDQESGRRVNRPPRDRAREAVKTMNSLLTATIVGVAIITAILTVLVGFALAMSWFTAEAPPVAKQAVGFLGLVVAGLLLGRLVLPDGGSND